MWRSIMSSRFASWVIGKISVPRPRQQQLELDMQRLYIVTQMYKAAAQGKTTNMQQLMFESNSMESSALRRLVEAVLSQQVTSVAVALHEELTQAGDPALPAARMAAAVQRQRERPPAASGISQLVRSFTRTSVEQPTTATSNTSSVAIVTALARDSSGSGGGGGDRDGLATAAAGPVATSNGDGGVSMSAGQLAAALQRRIGFQLELRPSSVAHPEAGLGVFVRGAVRPGTVVAIFPGVLYGRTQLPLMPNYPRVDTDNPYLSCRYDQSIVDSKPWGRGDPGALLPPLHSTLDASVPTPTSTTSAPEGSAPPTTPSPDEDGSWWQWSGPLSSGVQHLEGRHPLALGHFVNHPGQGQSPNVLETSLDLRLDSMPHPHTGTTTSPATAPAPWLRAYLPVVQPPLRYNPLRTHEDVKEDDDQDCEDDNSKQDDETEKSKAQRDVVHANAAAETSSPAALRLREVLTPPDGVMRLLVLVATRGLKDGEELLQNYRMSPHVVRPDWYVVHDAEAEERRWARTSVSGFGNQKNASTRTDNTTSGGGG